jgi:hypothetical protein
MSWPPNTLAGSPKNLFENVFEQIEGHGSPEKIAARRPGIFRDLRRGKDFFSRFGKPLAYKTRFDHRLET